MHGGADWVRLVAAILACQAAGLLGVIGSSGTRDYFDALAKPHLTPPAWVFGPVWTVLYTLMGIATWVVYRHGIERDVVRITLAVFLAQLMLNTVWALIFFGGNHIGWALVELVVLWAAIAVTVVLFWRVTPLAGQLLLPYLAWVSFAGYLNAGIWRLN